MENKLKNLNEFKEVLSDYRMSNQSKNILSQNKLVFLISVTAGGRNTIITELLKSGDYHYIISDTTRHKRTNNGILEQNGREYWFRAENDFLDELKKGEFIEAAIIHNQHVSGISTRELKIAQQKNKIAISEIEIVGMHNIVEACPDAISIFVLPPNFEEWMKRLDGRGEMSISEKKRRLKSAISEFDAALKYDYYSYIINDDFHTSVIKINEIIKGNIDQSTQKICKQLINELKIETKNWLKQN